MPEVSLISQNEQNYLTSYIIKLKKIQRENKDTFVSTLIPVTFGIIHNLDLNSIMFHPENIVYLQTYQLSNHESIFDGVKGIIESELYSNEPLLTDKQLTKLIQLFNSL